MPALGYHVNYDTFEIPDLAEYVKYGTFDMAALGYHVNYDTSEIPDFAEYVKYATFEKIRVFASVRTPHEIRYC